MSADLCLAAYGGTWHQRQQGLSGSKLVGNQWYYQPLKDDGEVMEKLEELADRYPTRGFDTYYGKIHSEGTQVVPQTGITSVSENGLKNTQEKKEAITGQHKETPDSTTAR